jgi:ABC-type lipoprotein export system ATPase subunit
MKNSDTSIPALVKVHNLTRNFKVGSKIVHVLKNTSFDIPYGSFTIIYGPSGSGKSTLLNCLMGLDSPSSGTVFYEGRDLNVMHTNEKAYFRAQTMGIVQQTDHWVRSLSVIDNVALPLEFLGIRRAAALEAARVSLERMGMLAAAHKLPNLLSGGEQQRVAMARALVNNPSYIVADEPTGNLDSKNGDALMEMLLYLNRDFQRTIVLVTHNIEYLAIADQILVVDDGYVSEMDMSKDKDIVYNLLSDTKQRIEQWKMRKK